MADYVPIGPSPIGEECVQVGDPDYMARSRKECRAFIGLIRRVLGEEPERAHLRVKSNPHDFGTYLEVVCDYGDREGMAYAIRCENEAPEEWDLEARVELGLDVPNQGAA